MSSEKKESKYKWSWKFKSAMLGLCAILLYMSYWLAGMADAEKDLDIKRLVEVVAKGSLYIAMFIIFVVLNFLIFTKPNASSTQWMKVRVNTKEIDGKAIEE